MKPTTILILAALLCCYAGAAETPTQSITSLSLMGSSGLIMRTNSAPAWITINPNTPNGVFFPDYTTITVTGAQPIVREVASGVWEVRFEEVKPVPTLSASNVITPPAWVPPGRMPAFGAQWQPTATQSATASKSAP